MQTLVSSRILAPVFSFAIAALLATGSVAQANTNGTHWSSIIDDLQTSGVSQIGDFDLAKFREEAGGIQWKSMTGAPASVLSGSRQSAFFFWGQKQVYISEQLPSEALSSLPQLELHEALGATGYNDHNYSLSTALSTLAKIGPDQRARLEKAYGRTLFKNNLILAGGVSVSGGGDLATLYVKDQVLKFIMGNEQNRNAISDDFIAQYPSIDFEPLQKPGLHQVSLNYEYRSASHSENLSVYIPMAIWNQGDQARQALIQETARKIIEIFPATSGQALHTFHPEACGPESPLAKYPVTQDTATRQIQDFRAALKFGCKRMMPGEVVSLLTPAIQRADLPREAGEFNFTCIFQYGKAHQSFLTKSSIGLSNLASDMWGITEGDYLSGSVGISADGKIIMTYIAYKPVGGEMTRTPLLAPKDATYGKSEMMINGQKLTFECKKLD